MDGMLLDEDTEIRDWEIDTRDGGGTVRVRIWDKIGSEFGTRIAHMEFEYTAHEDMADFNIKLTDHRTDKFLVCSLPE